MKTNSNITTLKDEQLNHVQGGLAVTIIAGAAAASALGALVKVGIDFHKFRKAKKAGAATE